MPLALESATSRRNRCAVCKIDRKGRIVYLDSEAEKLFGSTQVDLFGRPLAEFLVPYDRPLLEDMTSQFNHYETFYDAAHVTLLDTNARHVPASLIISLNFDAGNPVNFQIIINPEPDSQDDTESSGQPAEEFFGRLIERHPSAVDTSVASAIRDFTGAWCIQVFLTDAEPWRKVTQYPVEVTAEPGTSPTSESEYVGADSHRYVVRAYFNDGTSPDDMMKNDRRVSLIARALARLTGEEAITETRVSDSEYSVPSTFSVVDVLGSFGLPAALINADGTVTDANQWLMQLAGQTVEGCDLLKLVGGLPTDDAGRLEAAVLSYVEAGNETSQLPALCEPFVRRDGRAQALRLVRLAPGTENLSGFVILSDFASSAQTDTPYGEFVSKCHEQVISCLEAASGTCQKLTHEHASQLAGNGPFYLKCLNSHLVKLRDFAEVSECIRKIISQRGIVEHTDLNVVVDQVYDDLSRNWAGPIRPLKRTDLPRARLPIHVVTAAVRSLLYEAFTRVDNSADVRVDASVDSGHCRIQVTAPGQALSHDDCRAIREFRPAQGVAISHFTVASELAKAVDGKVDVHPLEKGGVGFVAEFRSQ